MSELEEIVITEDDYRDYLSIRLRLEKSCQHEIQKVSFPFLFASGSELLRSYILNATEFAATLDETYRLPDRGFIWYLFSQAVREIQISQDKMVIKYQLLDEDRKPFKQFYL
ncbi:MAG: hypothetical protein GKC10_01435 [Methanosarcinales archaeon]|nr:hypothetical protein [Methanosarcinales archaeon]